MIYPVAAAFISGAFMYALGLQQSKIKQDVPIEIEVAVAQPKKLAANSFSAEAITPVLRNIEMNEHCKIIYSTMHKAPLAVHELLDKSIITGTAVRDKKFHEEMSIQPQKFRVDDSYYYETQAYRKLKLNRGHMAAASNYSQNQSQKSSTFTFANTIPQNMYNNMGIWNVFERYSRSLLKNGKCETVEIISGPIYYSDIKVPNNENVYRNQQTVLKQNGIVIPPKLYKIIKCNVNYQSYASGFIFQNARTEDNEKKLKQFEHSLEEIQNKTGLTFNFKKDLMGTLLDLDSQGMDQMKSKYDLQFFDELVSYSQSIEDVNSAMRRMYEMGVKVDLSPYKTKIAELAEKDINDLNSNDGSDCEKLSKTLRMVHNLYYLDSLDSYQNNLSESILQRANPCFQSNSEKDIAIKDKIAGMVSKKRKYKYPNEDLLIELFPLEKTEKTASSD